jgi:hypothetical protein
MSKRPSGWWFLLVPVVVFVGVGFAVQHGIEEVRGVRQRFDSAGADGQGSIYLYAGSDASVWRIEHSGDSNSISKVASRAQVTGPDGESIEYRPARGRTTFQFNDMVGLRLGAFTAPRDGTYRYDIDTVPPVAHLAVGDLSFSDVVRRTLRPVVWSASGALALLVLLVVLRRRKPPAAPDVQGPITFN